MRKSKQKVKWPKKRALTSFLFLFEIEVYSKISILEPISSEAHDIANVWWFLFFICFTAFILVCAWLFVALLKKSSEQKDEKTVKYVVSACIVTSVVIIGTLIGSYILNPKETIHTDPSVVIEVIGRRWWWEVRYLKNQEESQVLFETANEITIPVDQDVRFKLVSRDVIHSFWVPNLIGKKDMIPSRDNFIDVRAKKKGRFRGQCAEFCGVQHAQMAMFVNVVSSKDFKTWMTQQKKPAFIESEELVSKGSKVFKESSCIKCHNIRGIIESPKPVDGPDLTHLTSRKTIASGTIPNNLGHLSGWILDPQSAKPGALMPETKIESKDFNILLRFLGSLK